ncbi:TPA: hypothetical protein GF098_16120 [Escherichia coli]|nr:acyltransferase [Escherichia coli]MCX2039928.1 acyltransferase [Escherichia coli]HAH3341107.1 hypothetical protein [Escherichia coli]
MAKTDINNGVVVARFIAILLVVLLHASAGPFGAKLAPDWEWANIYSAISKQCIGIFIVITGFLYANKEIEFKGFILKGINLLVIPLAFWWVIYPAYLILFKNAGIDSFSPMKPSSIHLWFMYDYIAIYLFVPMIVMGCREIRTRYSLLIFAVLFYSTSLYPELNAIGIPAPKINVPFASYLMLYVFAGYIAARKEDLIIKYRIVFALLSLTLSVVTIYVNKGIVHGEYQGMSLKNFSPMVAITAISTTFACIGYAKNLADLTSPIIKIISKHAFGIYLVHPIIIFTSWKYLPITNYVWGIPLAAVFYIASSIIIVKIFTAIPILRRVV